MKVLLIDVDSKIPNLALMKISAYHKAKGDDVGFTNTDSPDTVYASVVFSKNKHLIDGLRFYYPDSKIIIGGSGYDLTSKLKDEIEYQKPDYTLYPYMDYSLGYTSRGCNRNCSFCIVPQKEGGYTIWQHPMQWYDDKFSKIVFLDNNILLDKNRFKEIMVWCREHTLSYWFTQGLDIRLLDEKDIGLLLDNKPIKNIEFAWDDINIEHVILKKIKLLLDNGFAKADLRSIIQFYVYVDSDRDFESGLYRCRKLKELGTNAFVMLNQTTKKTRRMSDLARWANRKWLYWSCDFDNYRRDI